LDFIDLKTLYHKYKKDIEAQIHSALDHSQFIMGPAVEDLENKLAQFIGIKYSISVESGTACLEIAFRALNIVSGDAAITFPFLG